MEENTDVTMLPTIHSWLVSLNLSSEITSLIIISITFLSIILLAFVITIISRRLFLPKVLFWVKSNNYSWDDALISNKFFHKVSWFVPLIVFTLGIDTLIPQDISIYIPIKRTANAAYILVAVMTLSSLLSVLNDLFKPTKKSRKQYYQAYFDATKIILYILGAILTISVFTGRSPWGILSIFGGLTAVTMLVFKDSILGFVASIQLTSSNLIHVGDWIEMPKYGADGDVVSMSIHTVKVQNFDKTIISIPTHALVASSFKNWRGMQESGGRRIKRAINIDISSITFCSEQLLEKLLQIEILEDYLKKKEEEINNDNQEKQKDPHALNERKQTNIGIFRAYITAYLKQNNIIHKQMTFLIRQLPPGENGLPLEIYVFSSDTNWGNYEGIQADIFDHLLAIVPEFELRVFQAPTGHDLRMIGKI